VPSQPFTLAWSADGTYLAAGTYYSNNDNCEVFVVDVAKASVKSTLKVIGWVQTLAFSPDGKWLAVGTSPSLKADAAAANLIVYDVPAFTAKLTVKASKPKDGFLELAWAADGKALCAIDGPARSPSAKKVRRWEVPAFTEKSAISTPQTGHYTALAVSPDNRTLAVGDEPSAATQRWVRLFDMTSGAEKSSFKADKPLDRLGFTPDGKALGINSSTFLSWWDVTTGQPTKPNPARFAIQPAGLHDEPYNNSISPDGSKHAHGTAEYPKFIGQGIGEPKNKYGAFVRVTDLGTEKKLTWRVGDAGGTTDSPVVAFSPDGKKLAATVKQTKGESLVIWAVPK
jgi:WD40 repeat protein